MKSAREGIVPSRSMPRVDTGGLHLHIEELGEGEPLLLIMGVGAQLTLWPQDFVENLVARGFRTIRFDNRDVGLSDSLDHIPPPNLGQLIQAKLARTRPASIGYDLHDMARDAMAVLDALGLADAHVVGVSMGGMIAQICAIEHPERVRSLTSIMSSPGDFLSSVGDLRVLKTLIQMRSGTAEEAGESRVVLAHAFNPGGLPLDEDLIRATGAADFRRSNNPDGFARQFGAIMATRNRKRTLGQVRCPSHVIHGTHDPLVPPRGGALTSKLIPGATLQMVERMGHSMHPLHLDLIADGIQRCAERSQNEQGPDGRTRRGLA